MANELIWDDLEEYKADYFEHFGHETNLDKGRGSLGGYIEAIIKAIETNEPIPRFPDDLTNVCL